MMKKKTDMKPLTMTYFRNGKEYKYTPTAEDIDRRKKAEKKAAAFIKRHKAALILCGQSNKWKAESLELFLLPKVKNREPITADDISHINAVMGSGFEDVVYNRSLGFWKTMIGRKPDGARNIYIAQVSDSMKAAGIKKRKDIRAFLAKPKIHKEYPTGIHIEDDNTLSVYVNRGKALIKQGIKMIKVTEI